MCGRFVVATPVAEMGRIFGFPERPNLAPRWNVAPTQEIPVIRREVGDAGAGDGRHLSMMRWGLVPFWAKDAGIGSKMINARADGVADKPAFREAYRRRRCLIPADGFYEWQALPGGKKQPLYIRRRDGRPIAFAGLWECWRGPKGGAPLDHPLFTATIVTTDANTLMRQVHDRMPVILEEADWDHWLDAGATGGEALMRPAAEDVLELFPVSTRVGSVRNDGPDLIQPIPAAEPRLL